MLTDSLCSPSYKNSPRTWNLWKLKNEAVISEYKEHLIESMDSYFADIVEQSHVSQIDEAICKWINAGLQLHVGRSSGKCRRPNDFLSPENIRNFPKSLDRRRHPRLLEIACIQLVPKR